MCAAAAMGRVLGRPVVMGLPKKLVQVRGRCFGGGEDTHSHSHADVRTYTHAHTSTHIRMHTHTYAHVLTMLVVHLPRNAACVQFMFGEMADETMFASLRVAPSRLQEAGFRWKHTTIDDALRAALSS